MEKGKIIRLQVNSEKLHQIQEFFIQEAENKTSVYLKRYINHNLSLKGKYICSDLFKETFDIYTESLENRKKYSRIIHNSAAVLANEMFHIKAEDSKIKKCIFLTGVPGAGKSFFIQSLAFAGAIDDETMIYEGDITTPTIIEKIKTIKNSGKKISIIIINPTLQLAQQNVINRKLEIGRGASCETMARIISKLPSSLVEIYKNFSEIDLAIFNKTTNYEITYTLGWEYLNTINHGSYEEVLHKLRKYKIEILTELQKDLKKR